MKRIHTLAFALVLVAGALAAQPVTTVCATNCDALIPDAVVDTPGSVISTLTVPAGTCSGPGAYVALARVDVDLLHDWVGDLTLGLTGPTAASTLLQRPGAPLPGDCASDDIDALFADGGGAFPCNVTIPASGPGPLAPVTPLSVFVAQPPAGLWSLEVTDSAASGIGRLRGWSVTLVCGVYPTVTIHPVTTSTFEGVGPLVFRVERSVVMPDPSLPSLPLTVNLTYGGTAGAGDYTAPVSVVIPAGAASVNVEVFSVVDAEQEPIETVDVGVAPGTDYLVGSPALASGEIIDAVEIPFSSPLALLFIGLALALAGAFALRSTP